MQIARKIHILERYKNTKIQEYEYAKDTEDTRTAGIAPSRLPPRRAVSWGGAGSIRVRPIDICGHCVYRVIHAADALEKLYI